MKTITLNISDTVFLDLEDLLKKKRLENKMSSNTDFLALAIIESINRGKKERDIYYTKNTRQIPALSKEMQREVLQ